MQYPALDFGQLMLRITFTTWCLEPVGQESTSKRLIEKLEEETSTLLQTSTSGNILGSTWSAIRDRCHGKTEWWSGFHIPASAEDVTLWLSTLFG
ncbi:hypothetical protein MAR_019941 [Mya arenaria]|uniref:Uncharacterized protein n=1 Tax=Mya arenaria TaxID=6604 RepID=A0ABY7E700_MYAAR|nr:hypothetical protein MAR_019941 [Mya arenaria]